MNQNKNAEPAKPTKPQVARILECQSSVDRAYATSVLEFLDNLSSMHITTMENSTYCIDYPTTTYFSLRCPIPETARSITLVQSRETWRYVFSEVKNPAESIAKLHAESLENAMYGNLGQCKDKQTGNQNPTIPTLLIFCSVLAAEEFRMENFIQLAPNYTVRLYHGVEETYDNLESVHSAVRGREFKEIRFSLEPRLSRIQQILQTEPLENTTPTPPSKGQKHDSGKLRWSLMPWGALQSVLEVLEYGAAKYSANNWKLVEPSRYKDAMLRHCLAYAKGEWLDPESGLPHLAHAACCILFILSLPKESK